MTEHEKLYAQMIEAIVWNRWTIEDPWLCELASRSQEIAHEGAD